MKEGKKTQPEFDPEEGSTERETHGFSQRRFFALPPLNAPSTLRECPCSLTCIRFLYGKDGTGTQDVTKLRPTAAGPGQCSASCAPVWTISCTLKQYGGISGRSPHAMYLSMQLEIEMTKAAATEEAAEIGGLLSTSGTVRRRRSPNARGTPKQVKLRQGALKPQTLNPENPKPKSRGRQASSAVGQRLWLHAVGEPTIAQVQGLGSGVYWGLRLVDTKTPAGLYYTIAQ